MKEIKVFAPASIANLSCGYDILGVCLDNIGDEITVRKTKKKGITIKKVSGQKLSTDISINVAGVSATALLNESKVDCGFEIEIHKGIKPGSGIGSSAASSAGSEAASKCLVISIKITENNQNRKLPGTIVTCILLRIIAAQKTAGILPNSANIVAS